MWPERLIYAFSYRKPLRKALITAKYDKKAYSIYNEIVKLSLTYFDELDMDFGRGSILVPIPLHREKLASRGYNQAEVIANLLSKHYDLPVINDILIRTKATRRQSRIKSRTQRQENVKDAFSVNKKRISRIKNRDVILVDDICTTGATLVSAFRTLKFKIPIKSRPRYFYCLTLAKD